MKGIAWQAIFLLAVIALSILSTAVILWKFISKGKVEASKLSCTIKLQKYCADLIAGKNPQWNSIPPKSGCEKYGIEPPSLDQCKKMGFG